MSHLSKLKIVAQAAKRQQTKTEHRRGKLLEKLDDQLAMVQALIDGEIFTRNRRVWQKIETGVGKTALASCRLGSERWCLIHKSTGPCQAWSDRRPGNSWNSGRVQSEFAAEAIGYSECYNLFVSRTYPRCRRLRGPTIALRHPSDRIRPATFRARLARAGSGMARASNTSRAVIHSSPAAVGRP